MPYMFWEMAVIIKYFNFLPCVIVSNYIITLEKNIYVFPNFHNIFFYCFEAY